MCLTDSQVTCIVTDTNHQVTCIVTDTNHQVTCIVTDTNHQVTCIITDPNHQVTCIVTDTNHQVTCKVTDTTLITYSQVLPQLIGMRLEKCERTPNPKCKEKLWGQKIISVSQIHNGPVGLKAVKSFTEHLRY